MALALLERDHELAMAHTAVTAAARGRGGVLVVGGPPGAGRSALLDAVCAAVPPEFLVLRGDAAAAERDFGFGLVQQLCQPLVSAAAPADVDRWLRGPAAPVRPLLLDEPWSPGHAVHEAVLHGLHSFLVNVSEDRPVLLAVDDLQWADAPSLRWLAYLGRRVRTARILVAGALCEGRDVREPRLLGDVCATANHVLEPVPLSPHAVGTLLAEVSGLDPTPPAVAACHDVTGGNPAAVHTVLSALRAEGRWTFVARDLQPLLRDRRLAELESAPVEVRTLASAMAVLGDVADPELLCGLAGTDHLTYKSALSALDRCRLLADLAAPRLVHATVRDGVLAALPATVRERLHRVAARLLRDAAHPAEEVAEHLMLAGRGFDHAEIAVLRAAAGAALDRGATETAARYLRAALLNHLEPGTERAQLLVALAAAERSADPGAAARHVMMALPQLPAAEERAVAALSVPPTLAATEPALVGSVRDAWAEVTTHDREGRQRQLAARLTARMRLLALHDRVADPVAGTDPPADPAGLAEVDDLLASGAGRELLAVRAYGAALGGTRSSAEVAGLIARVLAREPATPAHAHTALPVLVPTAVAADAVADLGDWLELVGREARRTGSAGERALLDAEVAVLHAATGRLALAQETATAALAAAGQDWPETTVLAVTALTSVALRTQDAELAGRVLAHAPPSSDPRLAAAATVLRGMTDALAGDWAAALDRFLDCGHRLRRVGWTGAAGPPWRAWAVAAHRALGDRDAADGLATVEERVATAWGSPGARGRALLLRASLVDGADALELVSRAVDVLRGSADRLGLAAALTVLGRGRSDSATIAEGERIAAECGTYWGAEDSPYGGPVPRLRRSAHVPLTRTEDAVVALVRKGWTNQRIADDLGVTRRAVEKTLTGAYRKLGVPGRAALLNAQEPPE